MRCRSRQPVAGADAVSGGTWRHAIIGTALSSKYLRLVPSIDKDW